MLRRSYSGTLASNEINFIEEIIFVMLADTTSLFYISHLSNIYLEVVSYVFSYGF